MNETKPGNRNVPLKMFRLLFRITAAVGLVIALAITIFLLIYFSEDPDVVYRFHQTGHIEAAKFVPNTHMFVTGQRKERGAALWSPESKEPLWICSKDVTCLAISSSGDLLATGGLSDKISLWDLKTRSLIRECESHEATATSIVFSADNQRLYVGTGAGFPLDNKKQSPPRPCDIFEIGVQSGKVLRRFVGHRTSVTGLDRSNDGQWLVLATEASLALWSIEQGSTIWKTGHESERPQPFQGFSQPRVALSPNGEWIGWKGMIVSSRDGKGVGGVERDPGKWDQVLGICFSPDGRRLITGHNTGKVKVTDITSGKLIKSWQASKNQSDILAVDVSSDGKYVLSAGQGNHGSLGVHRSYPWDDYYVRIWKMPP